MRTIEALRARGIQPSAHRVAVADYVLGTDSHPSADHIWAEVRRTFPLISRATVYNTLNLLVERGLLNELALTQGKTVFDPNLGPHHHFVDDATGAIEDVPWEAFDVRRRKALPGLDVRTLSVVVRGRRTSRRRSANL